MKNKIKALVMTAATVFCSILNGSQLSAQVVSKGSSQIFIGYGAPNLPAVALGVLLAPISSIADPISAILKHDGVSGTGPYTFSYQYGVFKRLAVGVQLGYVSAITDPITWETQDPFMGTYRHSYTAKISIFTAMAKMDYHYLKSNNVDLYSGFAVGYGQAKLTVAGDGDPNMATVQGSGFIYSVNALGFRYMVGGNIGAFAEFGYGFMGLATFGISAKFGDHNGNGWQHHTSGDYQKPSRARYNDSFN